MLQKPHKPCPGRGAVPWGVSDALGSKEACIQVSVSKHRIPQQPRYCCHGIAQFARSPLESEVTGDVD